MNETNGSVITSGLPTITSFYPFVFSVAGGFPQLQLTQECEWRLVQAQGGKPEPCDDCQAGEFIREIGKQMIENYERNQRQDHVTERQD